MNEETKETQESWEESHPWLSKITQQDEDDSVDEVIRYTPYRSHYRRRENHGFAGRREHLDFDG